MTSIPILKSPFLHLEGGGGNFLAFRLRLMALAEVLRGGDQVKVDPGSLERTPILMEQVTRNIYFGLSQTPARPGCGRPFPLGVKPRHGVPKSGFPKHSSKMLFLSKGPSAMFCLMKKIGKYLETPKHISGELHKPVETLPDAKGSRHFARAQAGTQPVERPRTEAMALILAAGGRESPEERGEQGEPFLFF